MSEPDLKHVERDCLLGNAVLRSEGEPGLLVNEAPDQPGRSRPVNARARPRNPKPALVFLWIDPRWFFPGHRRLAGPVQELLDLFFEGAVKKIDARDFPVARAKTSQTARRTLVRRDRSELLQFANHLLVFAGSRLSKAADQLRCRKIVDRLDVHHGCVSSIVANRRGQPLEVLPIGHIIGKQISGIPEWNRAIALQFSPNLHPLAGAFGG